MSTTEHPYPESRWPGFVWREATVLLLEERDGGVFVELEVIVFEPCRPQGFRRLIKPLVDELPRKLMLENLNDTRTAVIWEARVSMSRGLALTGNR